MRRDASSTGTRLCVVRHGETAWNAERRLQGHLDVPLNATGQMQARATARSLADQCFDALYCSDLERARSTAQAIGAQLDLPLQEDAGLRERHYGIFQGLTYDEAAARHPEAYARFLARDPDFAFAEGGESLAAFAARVETTLSRIARSHPGCRVLVVAHGGVLDIAHRIATGKALQTQRDFNIPNAALNWIDFDGERWQLVAWADQTHLDDAARDELSNA